jgi:hypothetical protein
MRALQSRIRTVHIVDWAFRMRICYVAMPYGVKMRADGSTQDFEFFFHEGIRPAIAELGMECRRFDDFGASAFWQRSMFTGIVSSDVMIADISTSNPNVLYELGVRHALKRGRTILISATGERPPSNIGYAQVLLYDLDPSGRPTYEAIGSFRDKLVSILRQSARSTISDSPIYEFFPDLEVFIPPELTSDANSQKAPTRRAERGTVRTAARKILETPKKVVDDLKKSEPAVREAADSDPIQFLTLLRRYRDFSEWDSVIGLAQDAPPSSQSPEVRQILALALNRRGHSGDQERAISLMEALIAETGGDGETFGILGRIYKDRYYAAKREGSLAEAELNLKRALDCYRSGFEKSPKDIYSGINVVTLLQQRDDDAARSELSIIVPQLRTVVRERVDAGRESGRVDYWDVATELQLAIAARDWPAAEAAAAEAARLATGSWMVETTLRDLKMIGEQWTDSHDRSRLARIIASTKKAREAIDG